eukprot:TRINITY_DN2001_c0_g2_i2.p3 TRINITY_DN2001_c0_g2~~TRINITY_DN2001_c0_g2_i2.p3  ORF type:complete len:116 (-),score=31.88 TRINITY_DN2001_c0_g2_i2:241-588(-)
MHTYTPTIGIDVKFRRLAIDGQKFNMQYWEMVGSARFRLMTSSYVKRAHAIYILYDITNRDSFNRVPHWLQEMNQNAGPYSVVVLVGTKSDLHDKRQVTFEEGEVRIQLEFKLKV